MRYYEPPVQQYYQKMLLVPLSDPYTKFYNNPRGNWITRDERRLKEVEIDYIIDDRIRYKRHEFIQVFKKRYIVRKLTKFIVILSIDYQI